MKKYIIIGALAFGFGAAAINHDNLTGVWLLAWPLGAVVGLIAWATFARGPRVARKVEAYRAAAVALRRDDPETYEQILSTSDPQVSASDPDAYVALFLYHAEKETSA